MRDSACRRRHRRDPLEGHRPGRRGDPDSLHPGPKRGEGPARAQHARPVRYLPGLRREQLSLGHFVKREEIRAMRRNTQSGFSLIELLVAMVVTLFIVGAVVGLLTGGQSSFKHQPERTDRQQNIRVAMDVIMRDVGAAGVGMPAFMQTFQRNLNNVGPANDPDVAGGFTDQIALFANVEGHAKEDACNYPGKHSSHVFMNSGNTRVPPGPAIVVMTDGNWVMRNATSMQQSQSNTHSGDCEGSTEKHADIDFSPGKDTMVPPLNQGSGLCEPNGSYPYAESKGITDGTANCEVDYITAGDFVQYRINNGADGVPNLERNVNLGGFQVLARGVEQLQVQYATIDGVTADNQPALITAGNYTTLTTEVRVTLASRTAAGKFQGATT